MIVPALVTARLRLVPVSLEVVEAVLDHDKGRAEAIVGAEFPDEWPNDDLIARAFPYSREALREDPDVRLWGDSLVILRDQPTIVGSVVFHGRPVDGIAEVAYGIEEHSRGQGLAIEATAACVQWALAQPEVTCVQATTFPWHLASLGVIRRLGMHQVGTREHDTLGELLVFERRR
ncbi:MAG: GNAT family N-acetyltransferase [Kofleriaceae bacterium]